jgi:hypothetical protein
MIEEVKIGSEFTAFKPFTTHNKPEKVVSNPILGEEGEVVASLEILSQLGNSCVKVTSDCPGKVGGEDDDDDSSVGQMNLEVLYENAKCAVDRVQRTKTMLKEYFQSFDQASLNAYQLPRITALLNEANVIGSVDINPNQANPYDFIRIIRCCSRQVDWLLQILEECQSIVTKESVIC